MNAMEISKSGGGDREHDESGMGTAPLGRVLMKDLSNAIMFE